MSSKTVVLPLPLAPPNTTTDCAAPLLVKSIFTSSNAPLFLTVSDKILISIVI